MLLHAVGTVDSTQDNCMCFTTRTDHADHLVHHLPLGDDIEVVQDLYSTDPTQLIVQTTGVSPAIMSDDTADRITQD